MKKIALVVSIVLVVVVSVVVAVRSEIRFRETARTWEHKASQLDATIEYFNSKDRLAAPQGHGDYVFHQKGEHLEIEDLRSKMTIPIE